MPMSAGDLATFLGGELAGDPKTNVRGVASIGGAKPGDLVYVDAQKHLPAALASAASAVLVGTQVFARDKTVIRVDHPKWAFVRAARRLVPEPPLAQGVHPTAVVHPTAQLAEAVALGPHVVLGANVRVGARSQVGAGCVLGESSQLGQDCVLFPRVTLYRNVRLGNRVRVHSGAVLGSDGFGYVPVEGRYEKFPQRGLLVVEDDVEIGANCTIDRGALDETRIGCGTKLDNLVHLAHNVCLGRHCVLAAQTGLSGSVTVGNRVVMGGQVGVGDHCRIEEGAVLGAQCGVPSHKTIRKEETVWGTPARPLADFKKSYPYLARLPALAARLAALEKKNK